MSVRPGNCTERGRVAYEQASRVLPPCAAKSIEVIGTFPNGCFLKLAELSELVRKNDGRSYHPKHIGRSIRLAASRGKLEHRQLRMGQRAGDMKFRSAHGQGFNRVNFRAHFGMADPVNAKTRRAMSRRPLQSESNVATVGACQPVTSASLPRNLALQAAELALFERMAAPAVAAATARELLQEQAADAAMMASVERVRGPP